MICESCEGTGSVRNNKETSEAYQFGKVKCETCNGTGNFPTKITKDDLEKQANTRHSCSCESDGCYYGLDSAPLIELIYKISMDGGYISSEIDENGEITGYNSECPLCHNSTLALSNY